MEAQIKEELVVVSLYWPRSLVEHLQRLANQETNGNRSQLTKEVIFDGLEKRRQEIPLSPGVA